MMGLLGDAWFYVSAAGFLLSSLLFLFLLGQYRASVEAGDETEEALRPISLRPDVVDLDAPAKTSPFSRPQSVEKVSAPASDKTLVLAPAEKTVPKAAPSPKPEPMPEPLPAPAPVPVAAPAPKPEPAAMPAATAAAAGERRKSEATITGQTSPAVIYLQRIKGQMDKFDKDIATLKSIASQQAAQTEAILKLLSSQKKGDAMLDRVAEFADQVNALSQAEPAIAPASEPMPIPISAPTPAEAPAPVQVVADSTTEIRLESVSTRPAPAPVVAAPAAEPALKIDAPAPQSKEPAPAAEEPKPRKGPVWPI